MPQDSPAPREIANVAALLDRLVQHAAYMQRTQEQLAADGAQVQLAVRTCKSLLSNLVERELAPSPEARLGAMRAIGLLNDRAIFCAHHPPCRLEYQRALEILLEFFDHAEVSR